MQFYADDGDYNLALGKTAEALANYQKLMKLTDPDNQKNLYWHASALVRIGRCLPTAEEQKASYLKGMSMIEDAGMPDILNLLEHYTDACVNASLILENQGKLEDALAIQRKGLAAVEQKMVNSKTHKEAFVRKRNFTHDIALLLQKLGRPDEAKAIEQKYKFKLDVKQP
jgi:tetratricopeptide (TPR) repeat protein